MIRREKYLVQCIYEADGSFSCIRTESDAVFLLRNCPDYLANWLINFNDEDDANRAKAWHYVKEAGIRLLDY